MAIAFVIPTASQIDAMKIMRQFIRSYNITISDIDGETVMIVVQRTLAEVQIWTPAGGYEITGPLVAAKRITDAFKSIPGAHVSDMRRKQFTFPTPADGV